MPFSYKPLWKQLIDKEMSKKHLIEQSGISKSTMDKMSRGELVSMDVIDRICRALDCPIEHVMEYHK